MRTTSQWDELVVAHGIPFRKFPRGKTKERWYSRIAAPEGATDFSCGYGIAEAMPGYESRIRS
jgi:hypothetical protein